MIASKVLSCLRQFTREQVPRAVFSMFGWVGSGLMPHNLSSPIAKHSQVRNNEPTLKTLRRLSATTHTSAARAFILGSASTEPSRYGGQSGYLLVGFDYDIAPAFSLAYEGLEEALR